MSSHVKNSAKNSPLPPPFNLHLKTPTLERWSIYLDPDLEDGFSGRIRIRIKVFTYEISLQHRNRRVFVILRLNKIYVFVLQ